MTQPLNVHSDSKLEQVIQRFEQWRNIRRKRESIPQSLWDAAVELTRDYPVLKVSRALRLNYTDLKGRAAKITQDSNSSCPTEFVQLNLTPPSGPCSIEITRSDGATMSIRLNSTDHGDMLALTRAFLQS